MTGRIHFTCVIGGADGQLLPHLVNHYRHLGVTSFRIVAQVISADDPAWATLSHYARRAGIDFVHTHFGPWSLDLHQRLIRHVMDDNPHDWYVVADADELHVYDRDLTDVIELCERDGYDTVGGCLLDRVGADGDFPELDDTTIWQRYPLAGSISAGLLKALPLKVTLARGIVDLLPGQHGAPDGRQVPHQRICAQVHHFKWTASVVSRLVTRIEQLDSTELRASHSAILRENRRFLTHLRRHGGRIDITNPRLRLHPCGSRYADYPQWADAVAEAQGWQWGLL
jgi:hypothetical protein